jgi:hypothetical protein
MNSNHYYAGAISEDYFRRSAREIGNLLWFVSKNCG